MLHLFGLKHSISLFLFFLLFYSLIAVDVTFAKVQVCRYAFIFLIVYYLRYGMVSEVSDMIF